jgi:hypothetical protein
VSDAAGHFVVRRKNETCYSSFSQPMLLPVAGSHHIEFIHSHH